MIKSIRKILPFALLLPLAGCHHAPSSSANANSSGSFSTSSCSGNAYLEKYNCNIETIQSAAENGSPDAQYALGYMYYYGINTVKDQQTAILWIKRAAAQGQPLAQKAMSLINTGTSFNDLHKAASGQEPAAQNGTTPAVDTSGPITDHLPAYQQPGSKQPSVINSLKDPNDNPTATLPPTSMRHPSISDPRLANNAQPQTHVNINTAQHYTIQLLGSNNLSDIKDFIQDHHLASKSQYFSTKLNGEPWYILTYGDYANENNAESALHNLPASLRAHGPWVKSFSVVQKEVKLQKVVS